MACPNDSAKSECPECPVPEARADAERAAEAPQQHLRGGLWARGRCASGRALLRQNSATEALEDIASLYEILKGAKNPADLLMVTWMQIEKLCFAMGLNVACKARQG